MSRRKSKYPRWPAETPVSAPLWQYENLETLRPVGFVIAPTWFFARQFGQMRFGTDRVEARRVT